MEAVWVLNLDADLELGARGPYTPTRSVLDAMKVERARLATTLLGPGEAVVDESTAPGSMRGRPGRAFCPTPRALAMLERAGAIPEPHPHVDVLRTVNGRAFCSSLGVSLPGSRFVTNEALAAAQLADPPPMASSWRVKRAFGMAGRGQRVIAPGPLGTLAKGDADFVRAGVAQGGVVIEPDVAITLEVAIHGMLAPSGEVAFGRIVRQDCDARGVWLATSPLDEPFPHERALADEARRVARALHEAGYFGPFGIDAFAYDGGFQPRSEINARFSMGFAIGLPNWRDFVGLVGSSER